jgi:Arc/MetJ-type ribon-helix-helix transcriptional regulator
MDTNILQSINVLDLKSTYTMRESINLSLPREMRQAIDAACRRELRSRSELIREALSRYLAQSRVEPEFYTPTKAELRAIEKAREEMGKGDYLTLDEFSKQLLGGAGQKARAKRTEARTKTRSRAAGRRT